ncbi:MAG TPA: histidine--tRNA ligase [Chloroflexota bacterium]|nr:histidine--tRNA ligase [Chloroflexota bacterium]
MPPQISSRRPVERVRGTQDLWAADAQRIGELSTRLERSFASFGYQRIEVPVLEPAELHLRKSGLDIISKLYAFEDQGGRQLCLRPELTASVVRAFVAQPPARLPVRLFSAGPVFRYERPARGRYRQFEQCGVELIGAQGALADAEVIVLAAQALDALGLREYRITVGHVGVLNELLAGLGLSSRVRGFFLESAEEARRRGIGSVRARLQKLDPELFEVGTEIDPQPGRLPGGEGASRAAVEELVQMVGAEGLGRREASDVVERMVRKLAGASQAAATQKGLEILERLGGVRGAADEVIAGGRALLEEHGLSDAPLRALAETRTLLGDLGLDAARLTFDLGLSRGLQYYTGMVFEIDHAGLGAESQLCGGGRYDDLVRALGGRQSVPALGFAFGLERVALALDAEGVSASDGAGDVVYVVPASEAAAAQAGRTAAALRAAGVRTQLEVAGRPVRSCLQYADREGFAYVAVVGDGVTNGSLRLREMKGGEERVLSVAEAAQAVLGEDVETGGVN